MWFKQYLLRIVAGLITFVAGVVCYSYGSYYGGKFEAHVDVMRGAYSIRVYGTQDAKVQYKDMLSSGLGVELVVVAGCSVSTELREKTRGFNEVMKVAIEKLHGRESSKTHGSGLDPIARKNGK